MECFIFLTVNDTLRDKSWRLTLKMQVLKQKWKKKIKGTFIFFVNLKAFA